MIYIFEGAEGQKASGLLSSKPCRIFQNALYAARSSYVYHFSNVTVAQDAESVHNMISRATKMNREVHQLNTHTSFAPFERIGSFISNSVIIGVHRAASR